MHRRLFSLLALTAIIVVFFAVNMLASMALRSMSADLTRDRLYTLPVGARNIARGVEEPIRVRVYFSKTLFADQPGAIALQRRVEDTLRQFVAASGGKIELEVIDPEPFSEEEDQAIAAGLSGRPVGAGGEKVYFGLVATNSTDGREVIPWMGAIEPRLLNYELARLIYVLNNPVKPKIAVISGLPIDGAEMDPMTGRPQRPWLIMNELRGQYDVQVLKPGVSSIPEDIGVLLVVFPKSFSAETWYAIDQFIMRGGRAVFTLDSQCQSYVPPEAMANQMALYTADRSANLGPIGKAWKIDLAPQVVAGDQQNAIMVDAPGQDARQVSYVVYLLLKGDLLSKDDAVTTALQLVTVQAGGVIEQQADSPLAMDVLASTGPESMRIAVEKVSFPDPMALIRDFVPSGQPLPIAVRVRGEAPSAFASGPPSVNIPADQHLASSTGPINVIILSDSDMLYDRAWAQEMNLGGMTLGYQKFADNGSLLLNAVENLSGNSDLMSIRASASYFRPFTRVDEMRKTAEKESLAEEQRLQDELRAAEQRINEIQRTRTDGQAMTLTLEQKSELERARNQQIEARKKLRQVQLDLNREIHNLGTLLRVINIALVPAVVALFAISLGVYRVSRRGADRRRVREAEVKAS
ncbi:MAG: Gldg family protein [Phycisphaerales bacterium]|nr:Gldg family protein [Phycisphaerales bacterium]